LSVSRNTSYNLLGSIVPLAVSLVTIPIYLGLIGEARYGVLAIAWLLLGYFGLFDLGLGRATAQRIAAMHESSSGERAETFWTALSLNAGLGISGGLLAWPIAVYFFGHVFRIEEALRPEVQAAIPWLILAVPIATLSGVLGGALEGRARFFELNIISASGTALFQVIPLAAAMIWGADLGVLLPAAIFARLLTVAMLFERCRKRIFSGHAYKFIPKHSGYLLRFGGWVTVTSLVGPMMVIFDRFAIGAVSGAKAVSFYTIPFQLAERISIIPGALASALFPRLAGAERLEQERLACEGLGVLSAVMTPIAVALLFLIEPFLALWISPEFAQESATVAQIILLGFWSNSFAKIPYALLQAQGRPEIVAKCHLIEVLPYLAALYLGLSAFGIAGAAIVFSLRVLADFVLLSHFAGILRLSIRLLLVPGLLLGSALLVSLFDNYQKTAWVVVAGIHLSITLFWAWVKSPGLLKTFLFEQAVSARKVLKI
jgi:O-antigen/teichoic acid export membrane protein